MNSLLKIVVIVAFAFLIGQMCGCASSSLVDMWHDPSYQAPPLGKMLVVAVRKDATKRRIWEDAFTSELAKHGVAATPSYGLFPDAPPDTDQVVAAVQANGFDGILVVLRLPTATTTQYVQGYTSIETERRYSYYWRRYSTYYRETIHPGYMETEKVAMNAIDVTTTANGGQLVWSSTSKTPDPGSVTDIQRGIARLVMTQLAQRNIIGVEK